jgi:hypothetical protein
MQNLKKKLIIIISAIIVFAVILVLFISPFTKYFIQKNDEKYIGRQITMDWVYVNPFTGHIHFSNLKVYEYQSDSVFISIAGLNANFNVFKLFSKTLKVRNITINRPWIRIIQSKNDFNFNDLRRKNSSKVSSAKIKKPFHFYIHDIEIEEGHFYYIDEVIPVNFSIKNVDIESKDGWCWDQDSISAKVSFLSEIGTGGMKGNYGMNLKTLFYSLEIEVNTFDLNVVEQYMKKISNYGSFSANFDADIKADGCFKEAENINIKGKLAINDFHLGKNTAEDYAAFDQLVLNMDDVNPKEQKFFIDSALLIHPYFMYERFDNHTDNLQTMFGRLGGKVTAAISDEAQFNLIFAIGKYIKKLAKNFFRSDFIINRLEIHNGDIKFNDYSLSEKFALEFIPLTVVADSIDKNHDRVNISLESLIEPYGNLSVFLSINPNDTGDYDLQYHIKKIPVSIFNPYTITYTSFPLDRGTIEIIGTWNVRNSEISSVNHLVIIDPHVTKRLKNKDNKWIPVPLIMSFIRERGNIIDYEIPITGNFKDPKFHVGDVILDLLSNIFVKPPSTPYLLKVKNAETEIEKSLTMKWNMRQGSVLPSQEKFVEKMNAFLVKNPEAFIRVYPKLYEIKEKEYILFYEAKKNFYLLTHNINARSFNKEDSEKVDNMSIKDTVFVRYLNKMVNDSMLFTIQEKCAVLIDSAVINAEFKGLSKKREAAFIQYFKAREVEKRVKFSTNENIIPYNGFSYYKIEYEGEFPESINKAYRKMNELNDEAPREKFKEERNKSGGSQ